MKRNPKSKILIVITSLLLALTLSSCSLIGSVFDSIDTTGIEAFLAEILDFSSCTAPTISGDSSSSSAKDSSSSSISYKNTFTNTEHKLQYIDIDKPEVILLEGLTEKVRLDVHGAGETSTFTTNWAGITWMSVNPDVAVVAQDGTITAVSVGKTEVFGFFFDGIGQKAEVNVIKKELTDIKITDARRNFLVGGAYKPSFICEATFVGGFKEEIPVSALTVDSTGCNMNAVGNYSVNVSYTFDGVTKSTSYSISVLTSVEYTAEYLDYDYGDLYSHSRFNNTRVSYCPSTGTVNYLVIPVYFTDSSAYVSDKAKGKADIATAFFGESTQDGWNSVKTFYETESDGKLTINGKVSDWYEPGKATSHYGMDSDAINSLALDAVNWYFTNNPTENRADYDSDGNGTLDGIALIYGCPDSSEDWQPTYTKFWGMVIRAAINDDNDPALDFYMWMSYTNAYTDTTHSTVDSHVFIHETGHFFGLEDYYDYGTGDYRPAGDFTMQEHNTGGHDPFSCLALGWAQAIIPETSCTIELNDFQSSHTVIILTPEWNRYNSPFDEYIILELYTPTGLNEFDSTYAWRDYYPTGATMPGIRVWHVDARLTEWVDGAWSQDLITNPEKLGIDTAFTNSWDMESRISLLGSAYQDYSLLFAIRNYEGEDYKPTSKRKSDPTKSNILSDEMLFHAGDTFGMQNFASQFVKSGKLNSGLDLGWTVTVDFIDTTSSGAVATLNLTRTE